MTRRAALLFFAVALVVLLLPAAVVSLGSLPEGSSPGRGGWPPGGSEGLEERAPRRIRLYRADLDKVIAMDLEEYLAGVLLAEMPASFEMEALKAQAVIARTYALRRMRSLGGCGCDRSPLPADICSDSTHCQAWLDPEETAARWGPGSEISIERIREAVAGTSGEVAVFRGQLVEAVYHSTCGGRTEASQALWEGGPLPYLQSVDCPYCGHSPYYRGESLIPYTELAAAFGDIALPALSGGQAPPKLLSETPGGRVATLEIGGAVIEGKELRRLLELPSTAFTWDVKAEGLLLYTRGRGHGVGLCQYGADGAARKGKNYRQIISFYYPGAEVTGDLP